MLKQIIINLKKEYIKHIKYFIKFILKINLIYIMGIVNYIYALY